MYAVRDTPNGEGLELDGAEENLEEPWEQNSPAPHFFNSPPCCSRHTMTPSCHSRWNIQYGGQSRRGRRRVVHVGENPGDEGKELSGL